MIGEDLEKDSLAPFVIDCIILSGCLPGDGKRTEERPGGFWHGAISPISLIVGLFKKNIRIYEVLILAGAMIWAFIWGLPAARAGRRG